MEIERPSIEDYALEVGGESLVEIIERESDFNHTAQNPNSTAYGLGQFLNSTWETVGCEKSDDPYYQIDCMKKYVDQRYGSPELALEFWLKNKWY